MRPVRCVRIFKGLVPWVIHSNVFFFSATHTPGTGSGGQVHAVITFSPACLFHNINTLGSRSIHGGYYNGVAIVREKTHL